MIVNTLPIKLSLPDDFFNEETRCDYVISKKMKEIWAVELDLLNEFQKVCKKYNLSYYADGGTLLGAIRHKGFIPWDDDIDVIMKRDDYEKICEIAQNEFKEPYFWQTEYSDPSSLRGHAQLRNSNTTGILSEEAEKKYKFNQGIFIDIFPIDAAPDNEEDLTRLISKVEHNLTKARRLARLTDRYTPSNNRLKYYIKGLVHKCLKGPAKKLADYDKFYRRYEAECKSYNNKNTLRVAKYFHIPFLRKQIWMREDFDSTTDVPFETINISIPNGYERILDTFFGEWRTPVKATSTHGGVIFDTRKSYIDYIKEM